MSIQQQLLERLNTRTARVSVIGLGYVGLPLAVEFAEAGFTVIGLDVALDKVESVNRGESYIIDIPSERVAPLVKSGSCAPPPTITICVMPIR